MEREIKLYPFSFKEGESFASDVSNAEAEKCRGFIADGHSLNDTLTPSFARFGGNLLVLPSFLEESRLHCLSGASGKKLLLASRAEGEDEYSVYVAEEGADAGFEFSGLTFLSMPRFCKISLYGEEGVALLDGSDSFYIYDGGAFERISCPSGGITLTYFNGKRVLVTQNKVYFSDAEGFEFSEYSGYLDLPDGFFAKEACACGAELLCVGDRGMVRLLPASASSDICVKQVFVGGEKLFTKTLARTGLGAYVLSERGLVCYDSGTVEFLFEGSADAVDDGDFGLIADGAYHAGVTFKNKNIIDKLRKRGLISFYKEKYSVSEYPFSSVATTDDGEVFAVVDRQKSLCCFGRLAVTPLPDRVYAWPRTDFGTDKRKSITYLSAASDRNLKVIIESDEGKRAFVLKGKGLYKFVRPNMGGRIFKISLYANGCGGAISCPSVRIEY